MSLTDSGGIQEEAPTLRLPVVVARSVTERPEGIEAGWADLVGLDADAMVAAVSERLAPDRALPPSASNPYGDGQASERCAQAIAWLLGLGSAAGGLGAGGGRTGRGRLRLLRYPARRAGPGVA